MFSELARGKCSLDGRLFLNEDGRTMSVRSDIKSSGSSRRTNAQPQLRPTTSTTCKTRLTTATRSSRYEQCLEESQLILPKTYLTRTGELVLFAVVDDELFAMVDSSTRGTGNSTYGPCLPNANLELLSQFRTLENFVLSVLEYKHKKEKFLYASSQKKLFTPYFGSIKDGDTIPPNKISEVVKDEENAIPEIHLTANERVDAESPEISHSNIEADDVKNKERIAKDLQEHGESLLLIPKQINKAALRGKMISPSLEKSKFIEKSQFALRQHKHTTGNQDAPCEFINLHTTLQRPCNISYNTSYNSPRNTQYKIQRNISHNASYTKHPLHNNHHVTGAYNDDVDSTRAFVDSDEKSSTDFVPKSVRYILDNIQRPESRNTDPSFLESSNKNTETDRESSPVSCVGIVSNNTLMPFMFDGKADNDKSSSTVTDLRGGNFMHNLGKLKSDSLKDLANVNLHPRISSSRPAPELRALGVTPSAVKISQGDFKRILSASQDAIQGKRTNNNSLEGKSTDETVKDGTDDKTIVDNKVFWREGSFLSIEEAGKRFSAQSSANSHKTGNTAPSSDWVNNRTSNEDTDDSDDKILFSYIQPSIHKGSWNPMTSFSNDEIDLELSSCSEKFRCNNNRRAKSSKPIQQSERGVLNGEDMSNPRSKSCRLTVRDFKAICQSEVTSTQDGHPMIQNTLHPMQNGNKSLPFNVLGNNARVNSAGESVINHLRAASFGGSRPSSRGSSYDQLDEVLSIRSVSPSQRLLTTENTMESIASLTVRQHCVSESDSGIQVSPTQRTENRTAALELQGEDKIRNVMDTKDCSPRRIENNQQESSRQSAIKNMAPDEDNLGLKREKTSISFSSPLPEFNHERTFTSSASNNYDNDDYNTPDSGIPSLNYNSSSIADSNLNLSGDVNSASLTQASVTAKEQNKDKDLTRKYCPSEQSRSDDTEHKKLQSENTLLNKSGINSIMIEEKEDAAVDLGFRKQSETQQTHDPIKNKTQPGHNSIFVENHVFGSQQLVNNQRKSVNISDKQPDTTRFDTVREKEAIMDGVSYEQQLIRGSETSSIGFQGINSERGGFSEKEVKQHAAKQTQGLKIDLKMAKSSSEPAMTVGDKKVPKPAVSERRERLSVDRNGLRLHGLGGDLANDDKTNLDDIKMLIQRNKNKNEKAKTPSDRSTPKRKTPKPAKKRSTPSRKSSNKNKVSPATDPPKKMLTTETKVTAPIETENIIPEIIEVAEDYKVPQVEIFKSDSVADEESETRNVKVQNVEVEKLSDMAPDKRGAYPPSKPKKGRSAKKILKKPPLVSKRSEEKLKYEEQMRFLKEKEIEQQRARETAMAKQRALDEEKLRYQEEEETAKKKEEEARLRLAEAKVKAKEDREAKRAADAEKRRLLVEQRREERRQKELELAEKEKEAEKLKFERERRAMELRDHKERMREQERLEEEQLYEQERQEALRREEEEKRLEEERIKKAQEELEKLIEEREYREQLRRVAEAQQAKMREKEEQRLLQEQKEKQRIAEERDRLKRSEYLKLQAELERQKEAERIAEGQRKLVSQKAAKRKAELLQRREHNLERMFDLKSKREFQGISRSFTFTYFVHIPRTVWELPIGWNKSRSSSRRDRPTSTSTAMRSIK